MKRLLLLIALALTFISFTPTLASASSPTGQACSALTQLSKTGCSSTTTNNRVKTLVKTAINILSYIVGIASVIVIIIAGFRFITAGGDSNTTTSARNQLLYAVIGIIVVALAQVISRFALHTGSHVLNSKGVILYFPHILKVL